MRQRFILALTGICVAAFLPVGAIAQSSTASKGAGVTASKPAATKPDTGGGVTPPPGYIIGADDFLLIRFWGEDKMSTDTTVRPDGKVSLPLLNDVQAAGLTPEELAAALRQAAMKFVEEPTVTVIVREIRSRKVFVIGQVRTPGPVALNTDMNVLQVLSAAGGLQEYADKDDIIILRKENGKERRIKFKFSDVIKGKNVQQNILLQPGDTIVVN